MRSYCAFFGEEVAQVKNIAPTSSIIAATVIIISIIVITVTVDDGGGAAANSDGAVLVASAAQVVSVANAHGNVQIQNPGGSSAGSNFAPASFGLLRRLVGVLPANLPDRAAPAHVDSGAARTAGPLSGLRLAGGVAPGARRAVNLPGRRSSGEQLGSGTRVSRGPASREGPYIDVQFRRTRSTCTFSLFLLCFLFLFVVVGLCVFLITLFENVLPPFRRGERGGGGGFGYAWRRFGFVDRSYKVGGLGRVWFVREEVKREEEAVDEEFVGGEKVGLRKRRVLEHPELEFG